MQIQKYNNNILNCEISCVKDDDDNIYFKGKSVAEALGYKDTTHAIINNVEDDDKGKLEELWKDSGSSLTFNEKNTIYINESGLYSLILRSNKEEAKQFKLWITKEVLPSIRKNGSYTIIPKCKQISIMNETDLHYHVVNFIRTFVNEAIIVPGLGELQTTSEKRCDAWNKGYIGGQPDIMLLNYSTSYRGLCIELKTPTGKGVVSDNQTNYLNVLENNNFKTLISNDYSDIIIAIVEYCKGIKYACKYCKRKR